MKLKNRLNSLVLVRVLEVSYVEICDTFKDEANKHIPKCKK